MYRSDNPIADAERYLAKEEANLENLPECECCGEPITDEFAFLVDDRWYCECCIDDMKKVVPNMEYERISEYQEVENG